MVNAYVCNRSQPNLTTLLEIAQLLSVDMKELITDEKERNDQNDYSCKMTMV